MKQQSSFLKKLKGFSTGAAMADLAMLLLVFFMATTTTEPPKGVEVELPKAKTEGAEQDSIYISISNKGDIWYEGAMVTPEELSDKLAMRRADTDRAVAVTADKNLEYSIVKATLDVLKQQEFYNVVFMSESKEAGR